MNDDIIRELNENCMSKHKQFGPIIWKKTRFRI